MLGTQLADRFWARVDRRGDDECWPWTGATRRYGRITFEKRSLGTHRVSWELHHGPIPRGLFVLHTCDNPPCVNPRHLYLGTHVDNMRDMVARRRSTAGRLKDPARVARGERCRTARLTAGQVREIRVLFHEEGVSRGALAERFGVTHGAICHILNGRTWKHVGALP